MKILELVNKMCSQNLIVSLSASYNSIVTLSSCYIAIVRANKLFLGRGWTFVCSTSGVAASVVGDPGDNFKMQSLANAISRVFGLKLFLF